MTGIMVASIRLTLRLQVMIRTALLGRQGVILLLIYWFKGGLNPLVYCSHELHAEMIILYYSLLILCSQHILQDDNLAQSEAVFAFFSPSPEHLKQAPTASQKQRKFSLANFFRRLVLI